MRIAPVLAAAGIAGLSALPALAQTNPYARSGGPQRDLARESYGSYRSAPPYSTRAVDPYSAPRGHGGTIHWNTPNRDGNLGGPGGGGSAGSPGG